MVCTWENLGSQNLLPVRSGKFKMAAENNVFLNNSRTNGQIFKILTAYVHYWWHAHVKNLGSQNLLPVRSGKFKMAAENDVFLNNSRTNGQIFKILTAYVYYWWHAHVKSFGSQNLLPVRSGKFKMAAEKPGFCNKSITVGPFFKIPTAYLHHNFFFTFVASVKFLFSKSTSGLL